MSQIVPLTFEGAPVRAVVIAGEPLFVGKDVAERLGYADPTNAMKRHCKGVAFHHPLQTAGGTQHVRVIAEPDVLRLIIGSKLPAAQRFERWVFEEVLPSIRRTGSYAAPGRPLGVTTKLRLIREARLTYGQHTAQQLWRDLGLPTVAAPRQASLFGDGLPAAAPNRNRKLTPEMLERISARMAAGATEYEAERAEGLSGSTLKVARSRARAKASARGVQVQ